MFDSWIDVLLGFITWWAGLHFVLRARKRRWLRKQRKEKDRAGPIVMWLGAVLMAFGGLLATLDRRYRRERAAATERASATATVQP